MNTALLVLYQKAQHRTLLAPNHWEISVWVYPKFTVQVWASIANHVQEGSLQSVCPLYLTTTCQLGREVDS